MKDYYYLGKITKKYSFKGEVLLKIDTDQPSYYKKIKSLFIYKENKLTLHKIEVARFHKDSLLRLKFEGINSEKEANSIVNWDIYLPINNLPILTGNKFYYHDVINYLIIDEDFGEIGKIISIKENISQDLFVIDHNKNEVLIPIHDEFIVEVDKKKLLFDGNFVYVDQILDNLDNMQEEELDKIFQALVKKEELVKDFSGRFFFTPKKSGAQTAEANINAGVAAAKQIVGYLKEGDSKYKLN